MAAAREETEVAKGEEVAARAARAVGSAAEKVAATAGLEGRVAGAKAVEEGGRAAGREVAARAVAAHGVAPVVREAEVRAGWEGRGSG